MEFCGKCGSYMKRTKGGFLCPRCGNVIRSSAAIESVQKVKTDTSSSIYIVSNMPENREKVSQTCPKCGNKEVFHWFSTISGEHAGVRRERTVEHFKCTKCPHSWTKST